PGALAPQRHLLGQAHAVSYPYPGPNPLANLRGTFGKHQTNPLAAARVAGVCAQPMARLRARIAEWVQIPPRCIEATIGKYAITSDSSQRGNAGALLLHRAPNDIGATKR